MAGRETTTSPEVFRPVWGGSDTWISYGIPFPEACAKHVAATFKASRVYIIASGSLSRNTDQVKRLQKVLGDKVAGTRYGMQQHTLWSEILQISKDASEVRADLLITLGAGSLTDGAKIIALAMGNEAKTFEDLDKLHAMASKASEIKPPSVPIISIPTSLSGGEYNHRAGGTNDQTHRKYGFAGPTKAPALVILDPELTKTTPDRWWISTGVRAVDHCAEALCSLQGTTSETDAGACKGLKLLVPALLRCKKDPEDLDARLKCQMGVIAASKGMSVNHVPMGASHGIGHQLGPLGVGHGETSCILLPAVCKYNQAANASRQQQVKGVLWSEEEVAKVLRAAGLDEDNDLGDMLDAIFRALGMPRSLKDVGVDDDKLDMLAENSLHDRWVATNPIPLTEKRQVMEILQMVRG